MLCFRELTDQDSRREEADTWFNKAAERGSGEAICHQHIRQQDVKAAVATLRQQYKFCTQWNVRVCLSILRDIQSPDAPCKNLHRRE